MSLPHYQQVYCIMHSDDWQGGSTVTYIYEDKDEAVAHLHLLREGLDKDEAECYQICPKPMVFIRRPHHTSWLWAEAKGFSQANWEMEHE